MSRCESWGRWGVVLAGLLAGAAVAQETQPGIPETLPVERVAVPDAEAVKAANATLREVYKEQLAAAKLPAERSALSEEFRKLADASSNSPAERYALLEAARESAVAAGDIAAAVGAAELLATTFKVDAVKVKTEAITAAMKNSREPRSAVGVIDEQIDKAIAAEQMTAARQFAELLSTLPVLEVAARREAADRAREFKELEVLAVAADWAKATLKQKPADPEANLALGKYYCFVRGDWARGLPHLAACSDAKLKQLAGEEAAAPAEGEKLRAIADGWAAVAEGLTGAAKRTVTQRAVTFYDEAIPKLTGFGKTASEKKVAGLRAKLEGAKAAPGLKEIVVQALIDGDSELHVTPTGIYWKSLGVAKPGRHMGQNQPTIVNGKQWMPLWGNPAEERGFDQTQPHPLPVGKADFQFELAAIARVKDGKGVVPGRSPVTIRSEGNEQIVSIPDREGGSMWYTIRLYRR